MFRFQVKYLFIFTVIFLAACEFSKPIADNHPIMITPANATEKEVVPPKASEVESVVDMSKNAKVFRDKTKTNIRIGVLAPFSGEYAKLGMSIKNTALMALYEISSDKVVIQFYDTKGTETGARTAIADAINQGVDIVLGPVFSKEVEAIRDIAISAGIDVLAFTSDPNVLGRGIYTLALLLPQQVERIISYACETGKQSFAIITQDTDFGHMVVNSAISAAYKCENARVNKIGYYTPSQGDMVSVIKEIIGDRAVYVDALRRRTKKEGEYAESFKLGEDDEEEIDILSVYDSSDQIPLDFDAVLIAEEGGNLRSLAAVLNYYDITNREVQFLGTQLWSDPNLSNEKALLGGLYPEIPVKGFTEFAKRYRDIYGEVPPRLASQAYDGVALVSVLANNRNFSSQAIADPSGYAGVDGVFRLFYNGYSERGMAVMQIAHPRAKIVQEAPQTFANLPLNQEFSEEEKIKMEEEQKLKDYTINVYTEEPVEEHPSEEGFE